MSNPLFIGLLDRILEIRIAREKASSRLWASYGHLEVPAGSPHLVYSIEESSAFGLLLRREVHSARIDRVENLLSCFDDDLVVQLQILRPDLFFEHAAAVALDGRGYLFPASRGRGKSTLAWALLHHGFRYLSDELGPIDPAGLTVAPYSRAICLKENPSPPYDAPTGQIDDHPILHVPVSSLDRPPFSDPIPVEGAFFPRFDPRAMRPTVREIGTAAAAARLYANALNPLAHPGIGLDAALRIASQIPCYELTTGDLQATCELVLETIDAGS